jgi:multiple sugar transport system substrate-binding protein
VKKILKVSGLLLCFVMIISITAACSGGSGGAAPTDNVSAATAEPTPVNEATSETATEAPTAAETSGVEPTSIEVWVGDWWGPEKEHIEAEFTQDCGEGWSVNLVLQPVNGYLDSAIAAVASGSGPDVLDLDTLMIPSAIDAGLISPLDDFMTRYGITKDQFVAANFDAGVANGQTYSIPNRNAPIALFYNKTMFDAAGAEYPTDRMPVADFRELCKKLTGNGKYGFGIAGSKTDGANVMTSFVPFLWDAGGDFLNADMTAAAINTPESVKGIKNWVELYTVDKSVPEGCIDYAITRDLLPLAQTQTIAMFPLNDNNLSTMTKGQADGSIDQFEWDVCLLPGYGRAAGWSFTIPTGTKKLEAAEFFINYYIQPEVLARNNTIMPAVIEAQKLGKWGDSSLSIFYRQMEFLKNCPATPKWSDMQVAVIEELQNALTGSITPEEAAANMERRINDLLA